MNSKLTITRILDDLSRMACNTRMLDLTLHYLGIGENVFLVAKDRRDAEEFKKLLTSNCVADILIVGLDTLPSTNEKSATPKVVITTPSYDSGYSLSNTRIMITSDYSISRACKEQLEARIMRANNGVSELEIITVATKLPNSEMNKVEPNN